MGELGIDPGDELPAGEESKDIDSPEHTSETKEQHKLEAEQYIKDAIENEKKANNEYQKTLKDFAKLDDDVEKIPAATANEEGKSGLASKVAYLEKLHEAGSGLGSSQMQKSDKADIASASTTDRIAKAGWVLKRAANFRQKSTGKRMGDESERGDLQESSPANTNNDDVEAGENAGQSPKSSHHSFGYGVANTARKGFRRAYENTVQEWSSLHDFFAPKRATIFHEFFLYTFILILPSLFVAVMLFYVGTNPSVSQKARNCPSGRSQSTGSNKIWSLTMNHSSSSSSRLVNAPSMIWARNQPPVLAKTPVRVGGSYSLVADKSLYGCWLVEVTSSLLISWC